MTDIKQCTARDGHGQGVRCELPAEPEHAHACPEALARFQSKRAAMRSVVRSNPGAVIDVVRHVATSREIGPLVYRAARREADELEHIEQLGTWAAEDGDSDVLAICDAAFTGDVAAWNEALEWWGVWKRTRGESS